MSWYPHVLYYSRTMNKIVAQVNLSRSFQLRVFGLSIVQNEKLDVRKPQNLINVPQKKLRVFGFGCSARWKTRCWKTSKFDQCASEKTQRFSTPGFGYSALWKTPSGKPDSLRFPSRPQCFDSDTCCKLAKPKEGHLSKCLIHASRKSGKENSWL